MAETAALSTAITASVPPSSDGASGAASGGGATPAPAQGAGAASSPAQDSFAAARADFDAQLSRLLDEESETEKPAPRETHAKAGGAANGSQPGAMEEAGQAEAGQTSQTEERGRRVSPDAELEGRLRGDPELWAFLQRRTQSARDHGEARAHQRLQRELNARQAVANAPDMAAQYQRLPASQRAAWLQQQPEFRTLEAQAQRAVAQDLASLLELDVNSVSPDALGDPARLQQWLLGGQAVQAYVAREVAKARRESQEAGRRAERSQARRAGALPPHGERGVPAGGRPKTFADGERAFAEALASFDL